MVHIPKAKRNGKLNQQSAKCIFVSYPNDIKVYKFYNPSKRKFLVVMTSSFFENKKYVDVSYFLIYIYALVAVSDVNSPNLYKEALNSKKSRKWINATKETVESLKKIKR